MEDVRNNQKVIIDNYKDKLELIGFYLKVLDKEFSGIKYEDLANLINKEFGTDFNAKDISQYYEPNTKDEELDLILQIRNLHL